LKQGDAELQGKRDYKFLADTGFKYYTGSVTAAVIAEKIKDTLCR
jgi:hypothetical protein